jgi:thioredoxin 1
MEHIIGATHWNDILSKSGKSLICFTAKWCGPCKTLKPKLESLTYLERYSEVGFYTIDIDQSEELCTLLDITSIPTIIILKSGVEDKRIVGANYQQIVDDLKTI